MKPEEGNKKTRVGVAKFEKEMERRTHVRFLLNLPIEYYRLDSSASLSSHTENASEGGLMICLPERLEAGEHLQLKLFFDAGSSLLTIETIVQVMWVDALLGEDGSYRHGVKFVDITQEDLDKFKDFLDSLSPLLTT